MSSSFGQNIKLQVFGQSHSEAVGVVIDGLPAGYPIDMERVQTWLDRRRGGQNAWSTPRAEADTPRIVSGLLDGVTCGAPLCAIFDNANVRSQDYDEISRVPRPSHADYYADEKFFGAQDFRGGGHFSGRLTVGLVFAGAVCAQLLEKWDVHLGAHIEQIYHVLDQPFDTLELCVDDLRFEGFPIIDAQVEQPMKDAILTAASEGDSVGGVIECAVIGLPVGVGSPLFDGIENALAQAIFAVPAVRGIEFGAGFEAAGMLGSEHNDGLGLAVGDGDGPRVSPLAHLSNNAGGVVGGLTTGAPLIFRVAIKPTPSIAKQQQSVDLECMKEVELSVKGRHDPCIVPRAVPCIEAVTAFVLADKMVIEHE
ncbi:MAG: chorismate synthase [Coriobacteriia bacterium]|nr:chorismate synthase [Coriobacteriia bacterium]MCL2536823.1 chorismate synthase [Coriobacteriia bacterium]